MKLTKRERPVAAVTARTRASLASEPQWPNHTRRSPAPGISARSSSASATAASLQELTLLAEAMPASAPATASAMAGWL